MLVVVTMFVTVVVSGKSVEVVGTTYVDGGGAVTMTVVVLVSVTGDPPAGVTTTVDVTVVVEGPACVGVGDA